MVKKAKPAAPAPAAAPATPAPATPAPATTPVPATPTTPSPAPAADATTPAAAPAAMVSSPEMVIGPELQAAVNQMCEMGFEREQCMRALRAAYNNPDRAMQYLLDGIPEDLQGPPPQAAPAATPAATPPAAADDAGMDMGMGELGGDDAGEGLAGGPVAPTQQQIADLQRVMLAIQQNPDQLQQILQQVGTQRPDLLQIILQNQQQMGAMMGGAGGAGGDGGNVVQVTPEEKQAIERLMQLGFPEHAVVEAFLACDKSEEMAANYLFENFQGDEE